MLLFKPPHPPPISICFLPSPPLRFSDTTGNSKPLTQTSFHLQYPVAHICAVSAVPPNSLLNSNIIITVTLFQTGFLGHRGFQYIYFLLTFSLIYKSSPRVLIVRDCVISSIFYSSATFTLHRYLCSFSTKGETGVSWKQEPHQQGRRIQGRTAGNCRKGLQPAPALGPCLAPWR